MHYAKRRKRSQTQKLTDSVFICLYLGKGKGVRIENKSAVAWVGEQLTVKQKEEGVWEPILGFERGDGYMKIYQMHPSKFMQLFTRKG